jgi:hypothetical protein
MGLIGTVANWVQIATTWARVFDATHGFKLHRQFDTTTVANLAFDLVVLEQHIILARAGTWIWIHT